MYCSEMPVAALLYSVGIFKTRNVASLCGCDISCTAQKVKFSIKDFFSKCDQIRSFLRIWSHLQKKSLMKNFIFCAVMTAISIFSHCFFPVGKFCCYESRLSFFRRDWIGKMISYTYVTKGSISTQIIVKSLIFIKPGCLKTTLSSTNKSL